MLVVTLVIRDVRKKYQECMLNSMYCGPCQLVLTALQCDTSIFSSYAEVQMHCVSW